MMKNTGYAETAMKAPAAKNQALPFTMTQSFPAVDRQLLRKDDSLGNKYNRRNKIHGGLEGDDQRGIQGAEGARKDLQSPISQVNV